MPDFGTLQFQEAEALRERVAELGQWVADLEEAIRKHRRDTWGEGAVGHPNDAELYAVLDQSGMSLPHFLPKGSRP